MDLPLIWFCLRGVLLAGHAILDGFDLGVGILHPLARALGQGIPLLKPGGHAAIGCSRG
jgi:hypothetical protein